MLNVSTVKKNPNFSLLEGFEKNTFRRDEMDQIIRPCPASKSQTHCLRCGRQGHEDSKESRETSVSLLEWLLHDSYDGI